MFPAARYVYTLINYTSLRDIKSIAALEILYALETPIVLSPRIEPVFLSFEG